MKKLGMVMGIATLLTIFIGMDTALAGRVANRQIRQQRRIHQGIRSGELTRREIRRLERDQFKIQRFKRNAWSDGRLTPRERVRLEHGQNRASRHIYRLKHNDIHR